MSTTPTPDQTQALSLFTLLFSAPPGSWKDALFQAHAETGSLPALADLLVGLPQFQSRFAGDSSHTEILDTFLSFVGLVPGTPAHGVAAAAVLSQLEAGASVGLIAVQVLQFLQGTSEPLFQPARQYLTNLVEVASYHTVTLGLQGTSVEALRALIAGITPDPASVAPVKQALDRLAAPPPDTGPPAEPPPAITSADSVPDIAAKLSAYGGAAATANATGMTVQQLEALGTHAAKLKANGISHLSLVLGDALMTDAISAALLGKADGASVTATGASTTEVSSLATLAAHIAAGGITGSLDVTPTQLADVRGVVAPKLAAGLLLAVNGTAAADLIDLTGVAQSATATGYAGDDTYVVDSLTHTITEAGGGGADTLQSAVSIALPANVEVLSLIGSGNIDATGSAGDDTLIGNSGNNLLTGAGGNDVLQGGAGNDTLDGGADLDTLSGGSGDDTYRVDFSGDTIVEGAGEGIDMVISSLSTYTLAGNVEVLSLVGSTNNIQGTGNALDNTVHGTHLNDFLYGSAGNDTLHGNDGADYLQGSTGNDSLYGGNGDDIASVDTGSDYFDGGDGDDIVTMIGSHSDGVDTLLGGPSAGSDTIQTLDSGTTNFSSTTITNFDTFSYTTASNATRTLILGSNVTNEQGFVSVEVVSSNPASLVLDASGLGAATALHVGSVGNWVGNDTMAGGAGADKLSGGAGNDSLVGNAGQDTLDGGTGADTLAGGAGNDMYVVDDAGDAVTEAALEGTDTVSASLASYTLSANVEVLSLVGAALTGIGNAGNNTIHGTTADNQLSGGNGNDVLYGNDGLDTLNGGAGNDSLYGGNGNDLGDIDFGSDYFDGGAGDDTLALSGAYTDGVDTLIGGPSIGIDMIRLDGDGTFNFSAATVTNFDSFFFAAGSAGSRIVILGSNVTNDQGHVSIGVAGPNTGPLTVNASALGASTGLYIDNASFWDGSDSITGGAGNDSLVGGGGNDSLIGNGGNDSLVGGTGADTFIGGAGDDSIDGGDGNDQMSGGDGNDSVVGGDGVDYIRGGSGADTLDGGSGADTIHYRTGDFGVGAGVDQIADFVSGTDTLAFQLSAVPAGMLNSNQFANLSSDAVTSGLYSTNPSLFWVSAAMSGKNTGGYFFFVLSDNRLYIDPDGSGAGTAYEVAILVMGASTLSNSDIVIT